jgi:hypothetical protein
MPKSTVNIFVVPHQTVEKSKSCSTAGILGVATLGLFCPVCIPTIAIFLSSLGLGFLATQEALWVLLAILSTILLLGLFWGYKSHKHVFPLEIGIVGIIAIPIGNYILFSRLLTYAGVIAVVIAGIANLLFKRRAANSSCPCKQEY